MTLIEAVGASLWVFAGAARRMLALAPRCVASVAPLPFSAPDCSISVMAKAVLPAGYNNDSAEAPLEIELRNPGVAALLAWLIPGAGHLYQGRTAKGLLFFVCIMGTFSFGLWGIGGGKVVYASSPGDQPWRWQYYCQLGVGLPAMPALLQKGRNGKPHPILKDFMAQPKKSPQPLTDDSGNPSQQPNELAMWTVQKHPFYEIGTVYTVIAGLLNILVICDAYGGPLVILPRTKKPPGDDSEALKPVGDNLTADAPERK
jgi:hypothetical protein